MQGLFNCGVNMYIIHGVDAKVATLRVCVFSASCFSLLDLLLQPIGDFAFFANRMS